MANTTSGHHVPDHVTYDQIVQALETLLPDVPITQILWLSIDPQHLTLETWNGSGGQGHRLPIRHHQASATEGGQA